MCSECLCVSLQLLDVAAGKRDQSLSIEVALGSIDGELKIAILVMSVIARLNPADVSRDTCVRLVTLLMQLLDMPSGQVVTITCPLQMIPVPCYS